VIPATGRSWAKGLRADRDKIRETLFDLPVFQPGERKEWHRKFLKKLDKVKIFLDFAKF